MQYCIFARHEGKRTIATEYHEDGEVPHPEGAAEERSFDKLARGLANGTISRSQALKLAGTSVLGGLLGGFSLSKDAQAQQRKVAAARQGQGNGGQRGSTFRFLTNDPQSFDQRPCFSPQGDLVLFMRSPANNNNSKSEFWSVPVAGGEAKLFFEDPSIQATRPDWSRSRNSYQIAFTGQQGDVFGLYLLDARTRDFRHLPLDVDSTNIEYPSWYPDGRSLAVTDYDDNRLLRVDLDQSGTSPPTVAQVTQLTDPTEVLAGMSSVSPDSTRDNAILAFAGQAPNGEYNELTNQIWIQKGTQKPFQLDQLQGRTPWWSSDGKVVAFESNRGDPGCDDPNNPCSRDGPYQIYTEIFNESGGSDAQAVTPYSLNVQHPKWSRNSRSIVFSVFFPGFSTNGNSAGGIAIVDLSRSAR